MTNDFFPLRLYDAGFTQLVSVIPPNAALVPTSKIPASQLGKIPGTRRASGLWGGYPWRAVEATRDDVRDWCIGGANVGLRATSTPGVDIDCTNERVAGMIEDIVRDVLGPAPVRTGRAPKRLLAYRTDEPFGKMLLEFYLGPERHLVEILGDGQQYLVAGTHPATMRPYTWDTDLPALGYDGLTPITREQAVACLAQVEQMLQLIGAATDRKGDGRISRAATDQAKHLAPSFDALREAVELLPNNATIAKGWHEYITIGHAIRAAAGDEHEDEGLSLFVDWACRDEGGRGDPQTALDDWRRIALPTKVGWSLLAEMARPYGFNDAGYEFDATADTPREQADAGVVPAPEGSDQWLADEVVKQQGGRIRYVPPLGKYLVWEHYWVPDTSLLTEDVVKRELRVIADRVIRRGATEKEQREARALATTICSAGKLGAVTTLLKSERLIAVDPAALDHDDWVLSTPGGLVDLRSGALGDAQPDALCTMVTAVTPDMDAACPLWRAFLTEATGGDQTKIDYLQRLAGYALTGSTQEQHLTFIWGPGGNGKGVFLDTIAGVMGSYAHTSDIDVFTATRNEKHTTGLAELAGRRLVTASETVAGKQWDEKVVKAISAGDRMSARFMRQDNFSFTPRCKLVFTGNNKPMIRDIDDAMRRRIQIIHFDRKPRVVNKLLKKELEAEWPAILAWMLRGCLAWQAEGLAPPPSVRAETLEYFDGEDAYGRWLRECCEPDPAAATHTQELLRSYLEWANENGEWSRVSVKLLAEQLKARGFERWQDTKSRRKGFAGLRIIQRQDEIL